MERKASSSEDGGRDLPGEVDCRALDIENRRDGGENTLMLVSCVVGQKDNDRWSCR